MTPRYIAVAMAALTLTAAPAFAQTMSTTPATPPATATMPPAAPAAPPATARMPTTASSTMPANAPAANTDPAPVPGANSFTEGEARSRIEKRGFNDVTALKKDDRGIWRGTAMKDGKPISVALDFKGNVFGE